MKKIIFILIVVLNTCVVYGTVYTGNKAPTCDEDISKLYALYETGQYNCSSGYYLPADTDGCVACPNEGVCTGGSFKFKPDNFQGLYFYNILSTQVIKNACADNFPSKLYAKYERSTYTCTSGQYLPANTTTCASCLTGYTCSGGTYNFNANNDQGITANNISLIWQDENGNAIDSGTCSYGEAISLPTTPTKTGYTFDGWMVVSN